MWKRLLEILKKCSNPCKCLLGSCIVLWPPMWFSSSTASTFFFVCSVSFYHTELCDLPNLMRGLADLRSLFHLQTQFSVPGVKTATLLEIHLKLATHFVILSLIWGPKSRPESVTGWSMFWRYKECLNELWMQVHGYSACVTHEKMSSVRVWDELIDTFRW